MDIVAVNSEPRVILSVTLGGLNDETPGIPCHSQLIEVRLRHDDLPGDIQPDRGYRPGRAEDDIGGIRIAEYVRLCDGSDIAVASREAECAPP
jgi:hypothetical protein